MADLKRKRASKGNDRPNKKVVVAQPSPADVIKVQMVRDTDHWCPIVASMPGLSIPPNLDFNSYQKQRSQGRQPQRPSQRDESPIRQKEWLLHSASHPRIDYTGREEESGSSETLLKHYVAVFDPMTGGLQVMEARRVVLRGTLRKEEDEVQEAKEIQSNAALRMELGRTFGTKKSKKAIEARIENAISPKKPNPTQASSQAEAPSSQATKPDRNADALLKSMKSTTGDVATREELQAVIDAAKPRPDADLTAQTPADVYPLEKLVGEEELKMLMVREWQQAAQNDTPISTKSRFVSKRLQRVATSGDVLRLKVLRYMLLLLDFFGALKPPGKGGSRRFPTREELRTELGVGDFLLESTIRRFADGNVLTKWHVNNLLTHIAALALVIDDFNVITADLRADLKLEQRPMTQYFQELGCKVGALTESEKRAVGATSKAEAAQYRAARLLLPLEFPKVAVRRVRKR